MVFYSDIKENVKDAVLDKVACFLLDTNESIVEIVKEDRIENPDARLIVPFCYSELLDGFTEDSFNNRLRDFLYEKDLFGVAVPLRDDSLFFGKDRTYVMLNGTWYLS